MPHSLAPLLFAPDRQYLHRYGFSIRAVERERLVSGALTRQSSRRGRTHQNIAPKERHIGDRHATAWPRGGIPEHKRRFGPIRAFTGDVGVVTRKTVEGAAGQLRGIRGDLDEPVVRGTRDGVSGRSRNRVVELRSHQRAPGRFQNWPAVASAGRRVSRERDQRLRHTLEPQLDLSVATFERCARAVYALQGPGVAVRPAELTRNRFGSGALRALKEFVQARNAKRTLRLELGQQVAQAGQRRMRCVMIGAHEYRDVLAGRALRERGAHLRPDVGQPRAGNRQRSTDLVSLRWELP